MIRYSVTKAKLEEDIEKQCPGWLQETAERTKVFRSKGRYDEEKKPLWSKVKIVYMRLQGECKCAYCERKLESTDFGKIEQDVEHFRPKGGVRAWKVPTALQKAGIKVTDVPDEDRGYYLLPYHPFNYSAACKPCNSALKKDFFPIAGKYRLTGDDPAKLTSEKPYLICPVGDFDEDPSDLIGFHGVSPRALANTGYARARALVTIEFFKLDDAKRKNLIRERAQIIITLHPFLEKLADGATGTAKSDAQRIVNGLTSSESAHTNCAKSFQALFNGNRIEAKAVFDAALMVVTSIS